MITIPSISLNIADKITLVNGIPLWILTGANRDVLKIDVIIKAGRFEETKRLTTRAISSLLREGTINYSAKNISETFDYYGVTMKSPIQMDTLEFSFFMMQKHLKNVKNVISELFTKAVFPQKELDIFVNRCLNQFKIDQENNEIVAFRAFTEKIYGPNHPYGYNSTPELYQSLLREDLKSFYNEYFCSSYIEIIVSGCPTPETLGTLSEIFSSIPTNEIAKYPEHTTISAPIQTYRSSIEGSAQSSIRMGNICMKTTDEHYPSFYLANTILGGYFGSRLMSEIREKKGYTYGIYTQLEHMKNSSYFTLASDMDKKHVNKALKSIKNEVHKLQDDLVKEEELNMVKNYLSGTFLQMMDGPLKSSEIIKEQISLNLDLFDFDKHMKALSSVTAEDINIAAKQFLFPDDWYVVIVD